MNFSIERTPLLQALQKMQTVVEKKNTVQILGNFLFSVKGSLLSLCATDLEVGIKIILPVETVLEGRITVSAKHILDIVKELPDQVLHIKQKENNWIDISCGKSLFNIVSLSAEQYPYLPNFEEKTYCEAKTEALIEMIDRTQFAASTDATRYQLNGVYFEQLENKLMRMIATDSHRLSFVDSEIFLNNPDLKKGVMIPRKGLLEFKKLLDEKVASVGMSFEQGYLFIKVGDSYLFIHLIEGEYPDYRPVIPKDLTHAAIIDRVTFHSALKRVSLLASEKSRGIGMLFKSNSLLISSSSPEMGEAEEEIDVEFHGDPIDIAFNSKYLLECLSVMKSNELEFKLKDRLSAGVLQEKDQDSHTYVIMPMRIER